MSPDKVRCPYCGQEHTEDMIVGITQTINKGIRTVCEVVHCSCGKNFKGKIKEEIKLKPRR